MQKKITNVGRLCLVQCLSRSLAKKKMMARRLRRAAPHLERLGRSREGLAGDSGDEFRFAIHDPLCLHRQCLSLSIS